ncbi:MAG: hypothetical protein QG622_2881, partial [Actinomycetota bacterium]|nr:hypothetical protein [Actinomycetota bacterium]
MGMIQMTSRPALAVVLLASVGVLAAPPAASAEPSDVTSPLEAARVDRVRVSLEWFDCSALTTKGATADCTTAELPLDYDEPDGAKTRVAMLRVRATDPKNKIGTLFVNPGGPGGSGVARAATAPDYLMPTVLERFDVVGFDPRGTNFSDNVKCFKDSGAQQRTVGTITSTVFPFTEADRKTWVTQSRSYGEACSTTGTALTGSVSTAEVARDMDVLRRVLGDDKLTYFGLSYGTYLGNVYASLFPDRVRAIALDGVIDPVAWAGSEETKGVPMTGRLKSGEGTHLALMHVLSLCTGVGAPR